MRPGKGEALSNHHTWTSPLSRREERKAERQREVEAKRAARRGPMKLGTKKALD